MLDSLGFKEASNVVGCRRFCIVLDSRSFKAASNSVGGRGYCIVLDRRRVKEAFKLVSGRGFCIVLDSRSFKEASYSVGGRDSGGQHVISTHGGILITFCEVHRNIERPWVQGCIPRSNTNRKMEASLQYSYQCQ